MEIIKIAIGSLLGWIYDFVGNYGWALILFTLVGCNGNTSSSAKESSSVSEIPFTNKIEANLEEGEDYKDTALREVMEESGATASIIKYIGKSEYFSVYSPGQPSGRSHQRGGIIAPESPWQK